MEGESSVGDGEGPGVVFRKGEGTEGGKRAEGGERGKWRGRGRERRGRESQVFEGIMNLKADNGVG